MRLFSAWFALIFIPSALSAAPLSADDEFDIQFLKQNGIKCDAAGLVGYLKNRTLDDARIRRIRELIVETGHTRFAVRDRAAKDLLKFGVSALKYLEEARKDKDSEVADRAARLIDQIKSGPGTSLPIAVIRQLCNHASPEALVAVMKFLPFADDVSVEDEALQTLAKIGLTGNKADERIREFVKSPFAPSRAAAGFVLGRSMVDGDADAASKLLNDADAWVRLRTVQGMIAGQRREALPGLILLIEPETAEVSWRAEELLREIAGEASPLPPTDAKAESRKAYLDAWTAWLEKNGNSVDLGRLAREKPQLGLYVGIEYNTNSVWECGRDGKRRWTITVPGPMDAQVLPGNRVLIAEQTGQRISERDLKGNVLWEYPTGESALNCRRVPNGNTWIGTRNQVMEVRPNKTVVYSHRLSEQYLHAVRRLANGNSIGITSNGAVYEMTAAGKMVRTVNIPHEGTWGDIDRLPNGNLLVSNYGSGFVREVDSGGKMIREVKANDATCVERQANGQLLVSGTSSARMIDWTGRASWNVTSEGCVRRIHLR